MRHSFGIPGWSFLFLLSGAADGTAQMTEGSIRGHIRDVQGSALAGVRVSATSNAGLSDVVAESDAEGAYRLVDLAPGSYTLSAALRGFTRSVREHIAVHAGLTLTIHFELAIGAVEESVTVTGEPPLLETATAGQSVNVSGELQRSLPLAARRHWSEFLRLVPGTVSIDTTADQASVFFAHGAGGVSGSTMVDGADITSAVNPWTG